MIESFCIQNYKASIQRSNDIVLCESILGFYCSPVGILALWNKYHLFVMCIVHIEFGWSGLCCSFLCLSGQLDNNTKCLYKRYALLRNMLQYNKNA